MEIQKPLMKQTNIELYNLEDLSTGIYLIKIEIEEKLDHKKLNIEVAEFKSLNPTAENIAVVIWNKLRKKINQELELTITLYETPRNYVVYSGE